MSEYEKQVVKLTKFRPEIYADHQDYLASLVRHLDKWLYKHDPDGNLFADWDEVLQNWFDGAVHALNNGERILSDFPDREIAEPAPEFEQADEEDFSDESETVPDHPAAPTAEAIPSEHPAAGPAEPVETAKPLKVEAPEAKELIPTKRKKWGVKGPTRIPTPYDILTGTRDRYGIIEGTKTHDAVLMYERGTSAKELLQALGGRHYNILNRLKRDGHKVVKLPKHRFKIYHKDDVEREKLEKDKAKETVGHQLELLEEPENDQDE